MKKIKEDYDGKTVKGEVRNPTGKGGFQEHPENRNPGGWKKEFSFSYQYRRFMNMTIDELRDYSKKKDNERTVVEDLAYKAIIRAKDSLKDVREITDRTEGKPQQSVDLTTNGESLFNDTKMIIEVIGDKDTTEQEAEVSP